MMELKKLQNLVEVSSISYNKLLEAKISYSIIRAGVTSPYIILENASSALLPISPKRSMTFLISLVIAFILGFGFLFIKYLFYNEIRDVEDITNYTEIPFLGSVPNYGDKRFLDESQMIVDKHPKSAIAEAMRKLRTNLQFINNEEGPKIVSITSTIPGEGKTFIGINLAAIVTYSGKKVIILDLDMRKPKIHKAFNNKEHSITNTKGMSNILAGTHTWEECLKESRLKNLHFITAGNIPPNPSELILSDKMKKLIDDLKQHYDFIFIDNPPIGILADAMYSLQIADYPIYVLRSMYSYRPFILS
ncbi:MAG: polysaccharide biosynthesis tyrosine autokinase, partial [Bacteroidales bacterium]|nr:polysaccharide biosynthesis tyrosine autokinase [Bacteroidales bacterium]